MKVVGSKLRNKGLSSPQKRAAILRAAALGVTTGVTFAALPSSPAFADNRQNSATIQFYNNANYADLEQCANGQSSIDIDSTDWSKVTPHRATTIYSDCTNALSVPGNDLLAQQTLFYVAGTGNVLCGSTAWVRASPTPSPSYTSFELDMSPGALCGGGWYYFNHGQQDFMQPPQGGGANIDHYGAESTPQYYAPK